MVKLDGCLMQAISLDPKHTCEADKEVFLKECGNGMTEALQVSLRDPSGIRAGRMKEDDDEDDDSDDSDEDDDFAGEGDEADEHFHGDGEEANANCHGDATEDLSTMLLASLPPSSEHQPLNRSSTSSTRAPSQSPQQTPRALLSHSTSPSGSRSSFPEPPSLDLIANSFIPDSPAASSSRPRTPILPPLVSSPSHELRSSAGFASRRALGGSVSLSITVTARLADVEMSIDLGSSQARMVTSLPSPLPFEMPATSEIRGNGSIVGVLTIGSMPPINFGIQTGSMRPNGLRNNFISNEQRQRTVVCHADNLEQGSGTSVKGEGTVVELSVSDSYFAEMKVIIRQAKKKELTRIAQQQQLLRAMEKKKYSSLMAQITKAKHRKVEMSLIDQAEKVLKAITLPEGSYLNHKELSKLMKWKRVTDDSSSATVEDCPCNGDCSCNAGQAQDGEVMDIVEGLVQQIVEDLAPAGADGDKWLFKALVRAAGFSSEGCVWKSGGKFI